MGDLLFYETQIAENMMPLKFDHHKGSCGRICIVGGCKEYTGAPYFAGIAAMFTGGDLCHVICSEKSAPIIKSYSPELMVLPLLDNDLKECKMWISKCQSVVLGPGLGRKENIENAREIIKYCFEINKPLVVDADGIQLLVDQPQLLQSVSNQNKNPPIILTPNVVEFERLYKSQFPNDSKSLEEMNSATFVKDLANKMNGITICRKGRGDVISNGDTILSNESLGCPRRCGGQGDLLAGSMGVFLFWFLTAVSHKPRASQFSPTIAAAFAGSKLTREAARLTFDELGRGTVTSQIVHRIAPAFSRLWPN